jgi:two-component system, sensor histidine kinase and response regulator
MPLLSFTWKAWIIPLITFVAFHVSLPLAAQTTIEQYIYQLEQTDTRQDFDKTFGQMMIDMKSGKLRKFKDPDVMHIIRVARGKPFSDYLLPAVYGWAGTMFGDGRMNEALKYFMESAQLYEGQNKKLAQALSCFEIALVHHKAQNLEEAHHYYEKTLSLAKDSLDYRTKINCYNGFGLIDVVNGHLEQGKLWFKKAYALAEQNQDRAWLGILSGNIGSIHLKLEQYDSSLICYTQNLKFIKNTTEFENEVETYAQLGKVFLAKKDFTNAKTYLDSSVMIIQERKIKFSDFFNPMDIINKAYADLYAVTGDYPLAFSYYEKFHHVALEKQRNVNGRSLKHLESEYAFKQKFKEVEMLKKVNEANVLIINQQRYITGAFAIIILMLSIWAFNAYYTGRQRKKLNKDLSKSNAELERLNHVKDKLFSVLSHDLRSPLSTLKSMMSLLQDGHIKQEELSPLYGRIQEQLEASGSVLESLLQWAKAEIIETRVEAEKIVLADVVDDVAQQLKSVIDQKDIRFVNDLNTDLIAVADKIHVEIILRNLITNAVKFTRHLGIVKIDGKINQESIEVYVEDNGMGMHESEVKNLFDPGNHFTTIGTNQEKGTGLGLLITKEMIAKNGGNIWVSSRKHQGTTFTFTLPMAS